MKVYKADILTLDRDKNQYRYLVEHRGRILYLGNSLPDEYKKHPLADLEGRCLVPSFGDGHVHFSNWALLAASQFDAREAQEISQVQAIIKEHRRKQKRPKVIIGFGISPHGLKEKRLITRKELDEACSDVPLLLICYDGHSSIANSALMKLFPKEHRTLRGFDEESGQLFNEAYLACTDYATSLVPTMLLIKSILKGFDMMAQKGIGMAHCVEGIGFPGDADVTLMSLAARAMAKRTGFQTRIFFQTMDLKKIIKRRLPRVGGCFETALDGSFGSCDAALLEPYSHDPKNHGILFQSQEEVDTFVMDAHRQGLQVSVHAIGDAAVRRAVDAFEKALTAYPREDHRHIIIHACLIKPEDQKRIEELGLGITLQPAFQGCNLEPLEYLEEILGDRINSGSTYREFLKCGIPLSGGSDAPVTHPDPIHGIASMISHPFDSDQSIDHHQALECFSTAVYHSTFDEKDRGTLEVGKYADMCLLNRNPLEVSHEHFREEVEVEQLYLKGRPYKKGMTLPGMFFWGLLGWRQKI